MLLFARTTSFLNKVSFKYSILNDIVIKLKQWSLSANELNYEEKFKDAISKYSNSLAPGPDKIL